MDARVIIFAFPLVIALSWVLYNIGRLAFQQLNRLLG